MKATKNNAKSHAPMTAQNMQSLVDQMGFNLKELQLITKIPYRTLQDYYYGARSIPPHVADLLMQEAKKEEQIRAEIYAGIEIHIAEAYPNGFTTSAEED